MLELPRTPLRDGGDPVNTRVIAEYWIPAFAGMTKSVFN